MKIACVLLVVSACGSSERADQRDLPKPPPPVDPTPAARPAAREGCALAHAVASLGATGDDCATTDPAAAHRCVVDRLRTQKPFRFTRLLQGIDSAVAKTWAGRVESGKYEVYQLHFAGRSVGDANGRDRTTIWACSYVIEPAGCNDDACLVCAEPFEAATCDSPKPVAIAPHPKPPARPKAGTLLRGTPKLVREKHEVVPAAEWRPQQILSTSGWQVLIAPDALGKVLSTTKTTTVTVELELAKGETTPTIAKLDSAWPVDQQRFATLLTTLTTPPADKTLRIKHSWELALDAATTSTVIWP